MKKNLGQLVFFISFLTFLFILPISNALEYTQCVEYSITNINPSSINVGEEFTVGIQLENCGSINPKFVSFELINPPTDIMIKEPLITEISQLYYGNSERFITYHMRVADNAQPGTHVIKTRLSYGTRDSFIIKNGEISFEVIGKKAEINIASIKTNPVLPIEGDTVELTMRIENSGEGDAKSLKVFADHPFKGIKQSFIGTLGSGEDGPAIFTFITSELGEFEFPVTIFYYDDFGEKEIKTNINLTILEKNSNIGGIIFVLTVLILFIGCIFYFVRKSKSKDKIIHQLLKGNHPNVKSGR